MLKHKKAQVGETLTWVIATIILVVILLIFLATSIALSKVKSLKANLKANAETDSDWIGAKTEMAYSLNSENKNRIEIWISKEEKYEEE